MADKNIVGSKLATLLAFSAGALYFTYQIGLKLARSSNTEDDEESEDEEEEEEEDEGEVPHEVEQKARETRSPALSICDPDDVGLDVVTQEEIKKVLLDETRSRSGTVTPISGAQSPYYYGAQSPRSGAQSPVYSPWAGVQSPSAYGAMLPNAGARSPEPLEPTQSQGTIQGASIQSVPPQGGSTQSVPPQGVSIQQDQEESLEDKDGTNESPSENLEQIEEPTLKASEVIHVESEPLPSATGQKQYDETQANSDITHRTEVQDLESLPTTEQVQFLESATDEVQDTKPAREEPVEEDSAATAAVTENVPLDISQDSIDLIPALGGKAKSPSPADSLKVPTPSLSVESSPEPDSLEEDTGVIDVRATSEEAEPLLEDPPSSVPINQYDSQFPAPNADPTLDVPTQQGFFLHGESNESEPSIQQVDCSPAVVPPGGPDDDSALYSAAIEITNNAVENAIARLESEKKDSESHPKDLEQLEAINELQSKVKSNWATWGDGNIDNVDSNESRVESEGASLVDSLEGTLDVQDGDHLGGGGEGLATYKSSSSSSSSSSSKSRSSSRESTPNFSPNEIEQALESAEAKDISLRDARVLVQLMSTKDNRQLSKLLTTISNCATFTNNQNFLREAGCIVKLEQLLMSHNMAMRSGFSTSSAVVSDITNTITNLAVNEENQKLLEDCIPILIDITLWEKCDASTQLHCLQALTNLSVTSRHHKYYTRIIERLYACLDMESHTLKLQSLKVLVNLSCNPHMVPHLLAAKAPGKLLQLLVPDNDEAILLRWTTFLSHIIQTANEQGITEATLPTDFKAASPETMHTALYGISNSTQLKSKVFILCRHGNEDISSHSSKLYGILTQ
ncbi:unnamed protein product [Owenia fusiformis]|uniref:Armadillo repeat-containing domain-containing protein n=1 Tax=Owenia fusiformis TaxID=6347 RepID=A0A8S4NW83_OWEFU|nr:unnamed protein product [Owenia fusiformis]